MDRSERTKRLIDLALRGSDSESVPTLRERRYSIVKLLELGILVIVPSENVTQTETRDLNLTTYNNQEYSCITFNTGGLREMQDMLQVLHTFKTLEEKFKYLGSSTRNTQTQISDVGLKEDETQTGYVSHIDTPIAGETPIAESGFEIRSALGTLWGEEQGTSSAGPHLFLEENYEENTGNVNPLPGEENIIHEIMVLPAKGDVHEDTQVPGTSKSLKAISSKDRIQWTEDSDDDLSMEKQPEAEQDILSESCQPQEPMELDKNTSNVVPLPVEENISHEITVLPEEGDVHEDTQVPGTSQSPQVTSGKDTIKLAVKRKRHFCVFCSTEVVHLKRHILTKHGNEERIKRITNLDEKNPELLKTIGEIRREGNAVLNEILRKEGKELVPVKRGTKLENLLPCPRCGAQYSKFSLHKHYKMCTGDNSAPRKIIAVAQAKAGEVIPNMSDTLRKEIIPGMHPGEVLDQIMSDSDLISFGNRQCLRYQHDLDRNRNPIRTRLRSLARLKLLMMEDDQSITLLSDIFKISKWETFIAAISKLAKLEKETKKQSPTNVRSVGYLMLNLALDTKVSLPHAEEEGLQRRNEIQAWVELFQRQFNDVIGRPATQLVEKQKFENRKYVPFATDIVKLSNYIKNGLKESVSKLEETFTKPDWINLNKFAMLSLFIFNRKRKAEVQLLTVEDYQRKEKVNPNTDVYASLTESEKLISMRYYHVMVRGKLGRGVPLLIDEDVAHAIDLILSNRTNACVSETNHYLFGKGDNGYFNAYTALKDISSFIGAEAPELLTTRRFRTHIASVAQALSLTDSDLRSLCSFLGHTKDTHLEHYRMPSDALNTARISRLLVALDQGKISQFKGKTIDEINVDIEMTDLEEKDEEDEISKPSECPRKASAKGYQEETPKKKRRLATTSPSPSRKKRLRLLGSPSPSPKKKLKRKWTSEEIRTMKTAFSNHLKCGTLPSFTECFNIRKAFKPILDERTPAVMKAWIHNQNKKRDK